MNGRSWAAVIGIVLVSCALAAAQTTAPTGAAATSRPADDSANLIKRGVIRVTQRQRIRITHTTTATLQDGVGVRVIQGLPVKRPWSIATAEYGVEKLTGEPAPPAIKLDEKTGAHYFAWEMETAAQPGPTKFVTSYELMSATREFVPTAVKLTWNDLPPPRLDRSDEAVSAATDEMIKLVQEQRKKPNPMMAIPVFVQWVHKNVEYDEKVGYKYTDIAAILQNKRGHCGHRSTAFQLLCTMAGINARTAYGYKQSKREGLWDGRGDWNRHTWVEIEVPGIGWIEVEPGAPVKGKSPFYIQHTYLQNRYVQSAAVMLKNGKQWSRADYDQDLIEFKMTN